MASVFDIDEFLDGASNDETKEVTHGTTTFTIRRLNGAERAKFNDFVTAVGGAERLIPKTYERTLYVLGRCVLTGTEKRSIGEAKALKLMEKHGALADVLFGDIFEFTEKSLEDERKLWEDAKKNTSENVTTENDARIADVTGSTP